MLIADNKRTVLCK